MGNVALCLFLYRRKDKLVTQIENLRKCVGLSDIDLFVFSDGNKNDYDREDVRKTRDILKENIGLLEVNRIEIHESNVNQGLAKSITSGLEYVFNKYERAIVLEDDILVDSLFIVKICEYLSKYQDDRNVFSITGYNDWFKFSDCCEETFFTSIFECWGWATWRNRWQEVPWNTRFFSHNIFLPHNFAKLFFKGRGMLVLQILNLCGKIDSWAVPVACYQLVKGMLTVVPVNSLCKNIGFDSVGTHCAATTNNKIQLPIIRYSTLKKKIVKKQNRYAREIVLCRISAAIRSWRDSHI